MSNWLGNALNRAEAVDDWLSPQRSVALGKLRDTPWPNRKTEAWKYTSLLALAEADFSVGSGGVAEVESISGLQAIELCFVNGELQGVPADLPTGLTIVSLAQASPGDQAWAAGSFAQIKPQRHLFGLINDALATSGVIVDVAAGSDVEQVLRITSVMSEGKEAHTRVLVRMGIGAKLSVVEQYSGNQASFNTGFAEYDIASQAQLEHYRFALQTDEAMSAGGSHFRLAEASELNSTVVGFGSVLSRVDMDVIHAGERAHAKINAIYLLEGDELFDLHSTIEHTVASCTTEENVRGIVADRGRAVFNGRIHIHRHAQKTLAELNNRNLLLSPDAEVDTKPELEIYADDVRCAHGATIAEIDKKALYYLQSRGIGLSQANIMLNFGFINELVEEMPNEVLKKWLRQALRQRFQGLHLE